MRAMSKMEKAAATADNETQVIVIEDEAELTPKELAQERLAALEAQKRRAWLTQSAHELAERIPVSVFAMGSLQTAG